MTIISGPKVDVDGFAKPCGVARLPRPAPPPEESGRARVQQLRLLVIFAFDGASAHPLLDDLVVGTRFAFSPQTAKGLHHRVAGAVAVNADFIPVIVRPRGTILARARVENITPLVIRNFGADSIVRIRAKRQ